MRHSQASLTAQHVALGRTHLTWLGVVDDPYAAGMLRHGWAGYAQILRHRPFTRLGRNRPWAYLAARTLFFDQAVTAGLDAGARQVVVLGAGYDSRAWRLARPSARFFEVDHPATQADKRRRAPEGGPTFVPADLAVESLAEVLAHAGFTAGDSTVFTVEGVTMYLPEAAVATLVRTLAELGGQGSRLVINFGVGFHSSESTRTRATSSLTRRSFAAGHEEFRYEPSPEEVRRLLTEAGWAISTLLTGPELGGRYLDGVDLPFDAFNPRASVVDAIRA